jgi:hypothetical protein
VYGFISSCGICLYGKAEFVFTCACAKKQSNNNGAVNNRRIIFIKNVLMF